MATTTNYGWTTPDDTALVKDGASAIRTLGSSVDTSVKALNPGTTAGDLDYYTAATTKARIAKGTAGQVFTMNSGATAPEWQTISAGGMTLLSTTALSSTATTVSGISGSYKDLLVVVQGAVWGTSDQALTFRPNSSTTAIYGFLNRNENASPTLTGFEDTFFTTSSTLTRTGGSNVLVFRITDYANATYYKGYEAFGGGLRSAGTVGFHSSGVIKLTAAISSFAVQTASSATFSGGQILTYGVK